MALDDLNVLELTAGTPSESGLSGGQAATAVAQAAGGDPSAIDEIIVDFSLVENDLNRASDIDAERLRIKNAGVVSAMEAVTLREMGVGIGAQDGAFSDVPTSSKVTEVVQAADQRVNFLIDDGVKRSRSLLTRLIAELNEQGTAALTQADVAATALAAAVNAYLDKYGFQEVDMERRSEEGNEKPRVGESTILDMVNAARDARDTNPDTIDTFLLKLFDHGFINIVNQSGPLALVLSRGTMLEAGEKVYWLDALGEGKQIEGTDLTNENAVATTVNRNSGQLFFVTGKTNAVDCMRMLGGAMLGMATTLAEQFKRLENEGEQYTLVEIHQILPMALEATQLAKVLFCTTAQCLKFNQFSIELYEGLCAKDLNVAR